MREPPEPTDVKLDPDDPDPEEVERILESIPGALERAQEGSAQIRAGQVVPLEDL